MKKRFFTAFLVSMLASFGGVSAQYSAVRVNALALATGSLNAGIDVAVSRRWSVEGFLLWNPIKADAFRSQVQAFSAGVRRWRFEPHTGFFVGIHSTTAFYDVGGKTAHRKGWMTGAGASCGYSWLLSNRWNITAEAGLGCFYMKEKKQEYNTSVWEDLRIYHFRRFVLAPSRAEISFSYLF